MENIEIASISSRGQVVIPQKLREKLKIHEGDKFIILGEKNTLVLQKLVPSLKGIEELLKKTKEIANARNLKELDKIIDN